MSIRALKGLRPGLIPGLIFAVVAELTVSAVAASNDELFENSIRPVLVQTCFRCHGDARESGGLRVDSREALLRGGESGPAIVEGMPQVSLLVRAIQRHDDVSAMPPEQDKALRPDQVAAFENWIRAGAHWPEKNVPFERVQHWAFQPVQNVAVPQIEDPEWSRNAVDAFVRSKQIAERAIPSGLADRRTLIRRATFDLIGLPPTPEEIAAFESDTSPHAFEKVIDRLLASPHYGERWGRHWLDVVRYADTAGETADYPVPQAWKYRNYVIQAFNSDKPWDKFLREQVAGDIYAVENPDDRYAEQVTATGYLAISRRFGFDSENYHHLTIQDTIDTLGQSVMGLSLGCARCHDHKFDAISMTDYYGLYGIFDSSRYAFPGSEQKQKFRTLVPLLPPARAVPQWRAFDRRVATLASALERQKQSVPTAILRSLNDPDGDFEMQAPAAGGSNGVLVPPWLYEGTIAVTSAAQSPFRNLYARGRVGASVPAGAGRYQIAQSLYPRRSAESADTVHINLDFRIGASGQTSEAGHLIHLGACPDSPAFVIRISEQAISLVQGPTSERLSEVAAGEWYNLQLTLSLKQRTLSGVLSSSHEGGRIVASFAGKSLLPEWNGVVDFVKFESETSGDSLAPAVEFDNLGVQEQTIPAASTELSVDADFALNRQELSQRLQELIGLGGDFEFQTPDSSPGSPWNPGPNSVVRIQERAQSPYQNIFSRGTRGVHMPNRGEYDGFGLTLPSPFSSPADSAANTIADDSAVGSAQKDWLHACFDFRCADVAAGGDGAWRYYLGQGPGHSAAVELFFNGHQFYRRSGDSREPVCSLKVGDWYQVQLKLNLRERRFEGTISSETQTAAFSGEAASGWTGIVDYSFIDSYGHTAGVRPAIDVDNYDIRNTPFPVFGSAPVHPESEADAVRRQEAEAIRQQLAAIEQKIQSAAEELNRLLVEGPFETAYGMAEGTPHNAKIQLRGEPSQPGEEVPRGFIEAVSRGQSPVSFTGSGRRELAEWLTDPAHPLTARVMVNRIWQYHFGRGLVSTPNDFGVRGVPPTHPELLDYMATEFVRQGWSIKSMHRLIMRSRTYQQSSGNEGENSESDQENNEELYTRFTRRRLSAEEIRDSILFVTGELDREIGLGHPFPPSVQWGFTQHGPFSAVYDHKKRSVYLMTQRLKRHPFLALFDGPDPNASTASRLGTTVPTQALFFLNDPFLHAASDAWADRLLAAGDSESRMIELASLNALGRSATTEEQAEATHYLATCRTELSLIGMNNTHHRALASFLRTLLGSNEFLHVD